MNARSMSHVCLSKRSSNSQLSIHVAIAYFALTGSLTFTSPLIPMHPFHSTIALKYMFQTVSLARGPTAVSPGKRNAYYKSKRLGQSTLYALVNETDVRSLTKCKVDDVGPSGDGVGVVPGKQLDGTPD